ncbi:MAG TPA: 3-phosphoserine/phosphohydroxythreonine transaminase [Candidatus Saccharimonadia bacterium]|nr:3-phosphoserine/phosphohydroxythreonine transaminase [Candidatus Saccharimonadia bacterium]
MARGYNFSSGPAALPEPVLRQVRDELLEWGGERASVIEVSHRGKAFVALAEESERDLRELLAVPANYKVLFLQGGATAHFALLPMNFARGVSTDHVVTGQWSQKAHKESSAVVASRIAASSEGDAFRSIPARSEWELDPRAAYVHIAANETIGGVEFHGAPDTGSVPLVADMSSNILSRPIDVSKYGVVYAGAQKNIGASGLVVLIVRDDLLERCPKDLPNIFNYAAHAKEGSLLNTPNTFGWYVAALVFKWLKQNGGIEEIGRRNAAKAALLYDYIDASGFYSNPIERSVRSRMNVPFRLRDEALDDAFLAESKQAGLLALKGHRAVGGMRASIYNAMPLEGVQALVDFMKDFARRNG